MKLSTKKKLAKRLLITQLSIYAFIIVHSIVWYVFKWHYVTKLCPGKFALHMGNLELNFNVLFWGLVFLSTLFVGRAFCGWGCMWGAYQDFVSRAFTKLKIQGIKGKSGAWILGILIVISALPFLGKGDSSWPTMFWFLVMVIFAGLGLWWVIERKSLKRNINTIPRYILLVQFLGAIVSSWILLNVFQKGFSFAFDKYGVLDDYRSLPGILFAVFGFSLTIVGVAVEKRFFCKHICPYGLLLRFLSAIPFSKRYKVRITGEPCIKCAQCNKNCPMGLNPMEEINTYGVVKSPECINCLRCVAKCPKYTLDFIGK
jgi:polyferredoxin